MGGRRPQNTCRAVLPWTSIELPPSTAPRTSLKLETVGEGVDAGMVEWWEMHG
ncbi:hypothetical protein ARMGADRAFT_1021126 [Armillaria gallica]|nr:hypothetical protein ARMGADRAFT_1021126 [Armillaria gallica]